MPQSTAEKLSNFLGHLESAIGARASGHDAIERASQRIFRDTGGTAILREVASVRLPACDNLDICYRNLAAGDSDLRDLAASFEAIEPLLVWTRRQGSPDAPDFAENHANAVIVGTGGLLASDDVVIGASVMSSHTTYPDHRHPPEEVYIALSPGQWRQEDGAWHEPGIGGLVYNPPNIIHSMRAGLSPLFAIWCLARA